MNPVRFALAGFGAWGKFHAHSIAGNSDAEMVAIAAPSEASREEARRLHPSARIFTGSLAMIAEAEFDIIDIATPSHTHRALALAAMERGKHVLLEKPMATTLDDCKAIVAAAQKHGVHLAVGHEFRLSSQWGEIKRIIERGTIGEPQYVLVELSRLVAGLMSTTGCLSMHVVNNQARPHWECAPEEKYARQVEGRPGYYALLPLTIIADIATLPFQAIVIGMAHEGWVNIDGWPVPLPF